MLASNMPGILVKGRLCTSTPGQRLRESSFKWAANGCGAEPVPLHAALWSCSATGGARNATPSCLQTD